MQNQGTRNLVRTLGTLVVLSIALLLGCEKIKNSLPGTDGKVKLETEQQKYSYALGQIVGSDFKSKGIEIDEKIFTQSFSAASAGKPNQMSREEMQASLEKLREIAMAKMAAQMNGGGNPENSPATPEQKEAAEKNKSESKAYLEKNKLKPGVKVTASGLQYEIHSPGKGNFPKPEDTVSVTYKGRLYSGAEFDASEKPVEFPLNRVIPGWTEGLQLLKPGGKMTLTIPSELAYGERDMPKIPAHSTLVFDVELKSVKSAKK